MDRLPDREIFLKAIQFLEDYPWKNIFPMVIPSEFGIEIFWDEKQKVILFIKNDVISIYDHRQNDFNPKIYNFKYKSSHDEIISVLEHLKPSGITFINTIMSLLQVEITSPSRITAYLTKKYLKKFNNEKFYNKWLNKPLFNIALTKHECRLGKLADSNHLEKSLRRIGNRRLSAFYFSARNDPDLSPNERKFFKGWGINLLRILLQHLIENDILSRDDYITLEASGEDMEKLVNYYISLGFHTWTNNSYLLHQSFEFFHVPMYAQINDILLP